MELFQQVKGMFRSYQGRHYTSRWVRKAVDRLSIIRAAGYGLVFITFSIITLLDPLDLFTGFPPQTIAVSPEPLITEEQVKTDPTLVWPVSVPLLTQGYRFGHAGIDIQDRTDLSIRPIDRGWVSEVASWKWGYGNHVRVQHPNGRSSLYAHLNKITVNIGQEVTRDTVLGMMGATGWATGVHLHLEIYQDGKSLNPISVLPDSGVAIAYVPILTTSVQASGSAVIAKK